MTIREAVLAVTPHVIVLKSHAKLGEYRDVIATARALDPGIRKAAPFVMIEMLGPRDVPLIVKGVEPAAVRATLALDKLMVQGAMASLDAPGDLPPLVIGHVLARKLSVKVGDRIELVLAPDERPVDLDTYERQAATPQPFRVTGVFALDLGDPDEGFDGRLGFTTLAAMQRVRGAGDTVTGVEISLDDPDRGEAIAKRLEHALGGAPYMVTDWYSLNRAFIEAQPVR